MNNTRRRILRYVITLLESIQNLIGNQEKLNETLGIIIKKLDYCISEEEFALDSVPENLQFTDRYDIMQDNLNDLESAAFEVETIQETLKTGNCQYKDIKSDVNDAIKDIISAIERR